VRRKLYHKQSILRKLKIALAFTAWVGLCYNDFLKFLLAHNLGLIAVGVEIVYDDAVRGRNLPRLSKVQRDLEVYRSVLACPVWLIGLKEAG
jgi:hypothetical protein